MAGFGDYLETKIADSTFRGAAYPSIANIYVGLASAAPTEPGVFNELANTGAYARVAVAATTANWGALGAAVSNVGTISFAAATADWAAATHFFLADSGTYNSGNLLGFAALTNSRTVTSGGTASFGAGTLTLTID